MPKSIKESGRVEEWVARGQGKLTEKSVFRWRLTAGSDWDSPMRTGREFQICVAGKWKSRDPNDRLLSRNK